MATQKPGEWASCILSRFEEQVNSLVHPVRIIHYYWAFVYRSTCAKFHIYAVRMVVPPSDEK